jgi:hypothetical protein
MNIKEINEQIAQLQKQRAELLQHEATVCGIGYVGDNYNRKTDKNLYARWNSILQRCYNLNAANYPCYGEKGVIVASEWYNFSNFKEWFLNNIYDIGNETIVVDKDILVPNNKIYSSDTCLLVPISFNSIFAGLNEYSNKSQKKATNKGGINKMENGTYQLKIFNSTFSNFKSIDIVNETRINIYKVLLNGLIQNYPTMPSKVKEAILNYQF